MNFDERMNFNEQMNFTGTLQKKKRNTYEHTVLKSHYTAVPWKLRTKFMRIT